MQPLISAHFFLQNLTFFVALGNVLEFLNILLFGTITSPHFFSIESAKHICGLHTKKKLIFERCQVRTSCHKPLPCTQCEKRLYKFLNVHWYRSLQFTTFGSYLQSSGIPSGDDMLCLTSLENKVLKDQLAAKDALHSVDFSQSRIGVKKCVFDKRTIKVSVSCS